jgi:hypothetical protein
MLLNCDPEISNDGGTLAAATANNGIIGTS